MEQKLLSDEALLLALGINPAKVSVSRQTKILLMLQQTARMLVQLTTSSLSSDIQTGFTGILPVDNVDSLVQNIKTSLSMCYFIVFYLGDNHSRIKGAFQTYVCTSLFEN